LSGYNAIEPIEPIARPCLFVWEIPRDSFHLLGHFWDSDDPVHALATKLVSFRLSSPYYTQSEKYQTHIYIVDNFANPLLKFDYFCKYFFNVKKFLLMPLEIISLSVYPY
jgi:hypothetical protein